MSNTAIPFSDDAPKSAGRPPKLTPTPEVFRYLAGLGAIQATKPEIGAVMGVTLPTLRKFFADHPEALAAYEEGIGTGKASLRRRQWKMAEKSPAMAIWLGKNWLQQADRAKHEHTGANGGPIQTVDLTGLTDEELATYERLITKLALASPSAGDTGSDTGGAGEAYSGEEPI